MTLRAVFLLLLLLGLGQAHAKRYNTHAKRVSDKLNVHFVCHTHDDAGWLKTADQYYWGSNNGIVDVGVQYILDDIMTALDANKDRKFVYAEMAFFTRWWRQQEDEMQDLVRRLVRSGQLSFVNGGYVQHDEAAAHFVAMLDQTTLGHRFLNETFGVIPTIGWQLDPFGHSATQASLFGAGLGFDALFFARADHQDMDLRRKYKELEFVWKPDAAAPSGADGIFTVNFASGQYGPPWGFGYEWGAEPVADDPRLEGFNVQDRVDAFVEYVMELANVTIGNDVIVTMGSDFNYGHANRWYKNMDKLVHYVNLDGRVNLFYSSPAEYVAAKHSYRRDWPVKRDDFFPYSDSQHAFWTGYFTSRPTSKAYIRSATSLLQAARQLEVFANTRHFTTAALEESVSLTQHHDAITGTAKQHVVNDYHKQLSKGIKQAQAGIKHALKTLLESESECATSCPGHGLEFCDYTNATICEVSVRASRDGRGVRVLAYNPLAQDVRVPIAVPIAQNESLLWTVTGGEGHKRISAQVVPVDTSTASLQQLILHTNQSTEAVGDASLVWMAELGPLSLVAYEAVPEESWLAGQASTDTAGSMTDKLPAAPSVVSRWPKPRQGSLPRGVAAGMLRLRDEEESVARADPALDNGRVRVEFDADTGPNHGAAGELRSLHLQDESKPLSLSAGLCWYNSSDGLDAAEGEDRGQAGGAYIFRPNAKNTIKLEGKPKLEVVKGYVVQEARQTYGDWATLVFRLYEGSTEVEVEWTIGPVPLEDGLGKEVTLWYASPDIDSGRTFFTDANGRLVMRRERDARPTWRLNVTEPVAGNFYPATASAFIRDSAHQLSVTIDRAQAVASLEPGSLEFLVHRRLLVDDARGVDEPLNETSCDDVRREREDACGGLIVRGRHWLQVNRVHPAKHSSPAAVGQADRARRWSQQLHNDPPVLLFAAGKRQGTIQHTHTDVQALAGNEPADLAPLTGSLSLSHGVRLPRNVQLLTLTRREPGRVLVRLAHSFQVGEGGDAAQPVTLDLHDLFSRIEYSKVRELTLSANQHAHAAHKRLVFSSGEDIGAAAVVEPPAECDDGDDGLQACTAIPLHVKLHPLEVRTFELIE